MFGLFRWNFGGPFGLIMAHFMPSGPCHSLRLGLLPLTTTHDSSVAHLGQMLNHFRNSRGVSGACPEVLENRVTDRLRSSRRNWIPFLGRLFGVCHIQNVQNADFFQIGTFLEDVSGCSGGFVWTQHVKITYPLVDANEFLRVKLYRNTL